MLGPTGALVLVVSAAAWMRFALLRYPFFADDYLFLDQVRGRTLFAALTTPDPLRNYWRPLSRQVYFWFVSLLGESPTTAHMLNAAMFLAIIVMLFALTRRVASTKAAIIASSLVALHEAADVPVLWASGSQDLLATVGALGALVLAGSGRVGWAALPFACGLLSKETVAVTPLIALWMLRVPEESWFLSVRRVAPLLGVLVLWAPFWLRVMLGGVHEGLAFTPSAIPAAGIHLLQAFTGVQWGPGASFSLPHAVTGLGPLVLVAVALLFSRDVEPKAQSASPTLGSATRLGVVWALVATLPVALVVQIWCSYYYLFAICGVAIAVGAILRRSSIVATVGVMACLVAGSQYARQLESFATAPSNWATQSHLSRFYFDRSMRWVSRYLGDLLRQRPTLPTSSTLFFSGTPAFASWQSADGPLVRWAYRDSSLRSYYSQEFSLSRARRGPVFVFTARNDSLVESQDRFQGLQELAAGQMLSEHFQTAREALTYALEERPDDRPARYCNAWLALAVGDREAHVRELRAAGFQTDSGGSRERSIAMQLLRAGDLAKAVIVLSSGIEKHAHDAALHVELTDWYQQQYPGSMAAGVEGLAARLLSPEDPGVWRRWAYVQLAGNHSTEAYRSLQRYVGLLPDSAESKLAGDHELLQLLQRGLPGGDMAQEGLKRRPQARP